MSTCGTKDNQSRETTATGKMMDKYTRGEILAQLKAGRSFQKTDLREIDLREANLAKADLAQANLAKANLYKANLYKANLEGAYLPQVVLDEANLLGACLRRVNMKGACLRRVKLNIAREMLYSNGNGNGGCRPNGPERARWEIHLLNLADKKGVNLEGTDLRGADLEGADLRGADLRGADLEGANLQGADLRGANLSYANLKKVDLKGARLGKTRLEGVRFEGASFSGGGADTARPPKEIKKEAQSDADTMAGITRTETESVPRPARGEEASETTAEPLTATEEEIILPPLYAEEGDEYDITLPQTTSKILAECDTAPYDLNEIYDSPEGPWDNGDEGDWEETASLSAAETENTVPETERNLLLGEERDIPDPPSPEAKEAKAGCIRTGSGWDPAEIYDREEDEPPAPRENVLLFEDFQDIPVFNPKKEEEENERIILERDCALEDMELPGITVFDDQGKKKRPAPRPKNKPVDLADVQRKAIQKFLGLQWASETAEAPAPATRKNPAPATPGTQKAPQPYVPPLFKKLGLRQKKLTLVTPQNFCKGYKGFIYLYVYDKSRRQQVGEEISRLGQIVPPLEKPLEKGPGEISCGKKITLEVWPKECFTYHSLPYLLSGGDGIKRIRLPLTPKKGIDHKKIKNLVVYVMDGRGENILCTLKTEARVRNYFSSTVSKVAAHTISAVLSVLGALSLIILVKAKIVRPYPGMTIALILLCVAALNCLYRKSYLTPKLTDHQAMEF